jgi:hypothetical protein
MFATKTPKSAPALWKGETQDGYTLRLSRSGLAKIMSNLKQTGLHTLVQNNLNGSREAAIVRAIAQVVSHATRSNSSQNTQVFTAVGKTRMYQIVTQPIGHQRSAILVVRSRPIAFENTPEDLEVEFEEQFIGPLLNKMVPSRRRAQEREARQRLVQQQWQQEAEQRRQEQRRHQELREREEQRRQREERQLRRRGSSSSSVSTLPLYTPSSPPPSYHSPSPSRTSSRSGTPIRRR